MANLPAPVQSTAAPGNFLTSALWNAQVRDSVNFLLNPPMYFGYSTTAVSISAGGYSAIGMDTDITDTYGGHSKVTNTSRYTCQLAGYYEVGGGAALPSSSNTATALMAAQIRKNGSELPPGRVEVAQMANHYNGAPLTPSAVQLNVGDYVELYVDCDTATSTSASGPWCSLYVKFLHP
ncbi:hypothetical protein [Streptomyces noursei]|uniref:hypothetical protein n=1 Tax=Streptomyces noursei TaxID=1971 RepID=UPI0037FD8DD3